VLQKFALLQAVSDLQLDEAEDIDTYRRLAAAFTPEDTQLFYQIAIIGRRDLELAPDARAGFEMVLLRMLAFNFAPAATEQVRPGRSSAVLTPAISRASDVVSSPKGVAAPAVPSALPATPSQAAAPPVAPSAEPRAAATQWSQIVTQLNLQGPARQLASHCMLISKQGPKVQLRLDALGEPFRRPGPEEKLVQALSAYFGETIKVEFQAGASVTDTPARQHQAATEDRLQAARAAIDSDPNVRTLRDMFGATVQPDSVRPVQ
jgi:DNA polymerase-3 subunit gamma/tau